MKSGDQRWTVGWKHTDGSYIWDEFNRTNTLAVARYKYEDFVSTSTPVLFLCRRDARRYIKRQYGYTARRSFKPQAVRVRVKLEVV
jgi:hypothetical protein